METSDFVVDFDQRRSEMDERELEIKRLDICYTYASSDDKKVVWAVLNKYVPLLSAEGLL